MDQPTPDLRFSPAQFRGVLGRFCSGVTVVTAIRGGAPAGLTCQSFFSVSLDPPLVAFAPARRSRAYSAIQEAAAFCVNILSADQQALATRFSQPADADKWSEVDWRPGPTGSPILAGALAWIDCRHEFEYEAGDHFLTIGRVIALEQSGEAASPLLFYGGRYRALAED